MNFLRYLIMEMYESSNVERSNQISEMITSYAHTLESSAQSSVKETYEEQHNYSGFWLQKIRKKTDHMKIPFSLFQEYDEKDPGKF